MQKKQRKSKQTRVAVLMATFNGEKYLKEQIDSIIHQKNIQLELFISDDASTDNSLKIIQSYCDQFKNIKCINHSKIGGPAKNFYYLINNINIINFDFISLSDQDDIWLQYRLINAVDKLRCNNADGYSSDVIAVDKSRHYLKTIKKSFRQKKFDYLFETPGPGCSFVLSNKTVSYLQTRLINNVLDFPYHDWLIYALTRQKKLKWVIDEQPSLLYRQHNNNYMGANFGFLGGLKRFNRILCGDYYREFIFLYSHLELKEKNLNFVQVCFFIRNFYHTRRRFSHCLLMILFLFILSIQKNEI